MAGDRARVSYDPTRKWRGVVAQQGRVTVEADWNEAATIDEERDRHVALDVAGPVGTPDAGYAVTAIPATGGPAGSTPGDLVIGQGTLYLGGERLDLDGPVTYSTQADWLDHSTDPLWEPPAVPAVDGAGYELVYVLASEQEVSAVEDPALADVALGGPDTMQRQRILQRFVRQPSQPGTCDGSWSALEDSLGGQGLQFDAASMTLQSATTLQVSFTNIPGPPSLCQPVATGGYLGAENQMIRVMVTSVGDDGAPTIVWGFDDASFLYRLQAAAYDSSSGDTTLTLASAPVDSFHFPAAGQAVELLRDAVQLTGTDYIASPAGVVSALTAAYDPAQMSLVIAGQPPADYLSAATPQLYLRVWQATAAATAGQAIPLGDTGVAVTLTSSSGSFHAGDFWRFALRPIQPAIVYPARYLAAPQPPDGPRTWACPLAVLAWDGGIATVTSCVPPFANLVELTAAKGGCCTVDVGPSDVGDGASLQTLLGGYANLGPVTVCLQPGTYTLPAPLALGPGLDGITLQACREGVVFQAPAQPGPEFVLGLIAVQGVSSVTIRGVELSAPLAGFSPSSDSFSGLPAANIELLEAFSRGLNVAIGISADSSAGLTVDDCTFAFPDPGKANVFGAGVFTTGGMDGLEVIGCTFQPAAPPATVPFHDLAVGNPADPPYQLTFGYLQLPAFPQERDLAVAAGADAPSDAATPQLLHDATIERCLFQGVTVPALVMAQLGTLRVDQNTIRDCYGGFWLVSVADQQPILLFDLLAAGNAAVYQDFAGIGATALLDRIFVIATAMGRVLPATPPDGGLPVPGRILPPDPADLALARQALSTFYTQATGAGSAPESPATGTAGGSGAGSGSPPDISSSATVIMSRPTTFPKPGAEPPTAAGEKVTGAARLTELPPALGDIFTNLGAPAVPTSAAVPVADTGTSVSLRLDLCDCQVDAIIADSYSGAGLVVADLTTDAGSALLHGSRIRSRFPVGETALVTGLGEASITGNIVANEVVPPPEQEVTALPSNSYSMVLRAAATRFGAPAVAITGNVFIDPTLLPGRPDTIPAALADWDVLNTVIAYVAPPGS